MNNLPTPPSVILKSQDLFDLHLHDLRNAFIRDSSLAYGAVVAFDFRERNNNRRDDFHVAVISGNSFHDAIARYYNSDESSGLHDSDFEPPVFSVVCQAENNE
ncbi:hypothetical protein L1D14_07690 [Vibrio tubiashii]|uniref:hypothetical protein n=1 Tax=Vibrio tubiashii TaxID=29498 RepID=UPI001EFCCE15|nr:hypothetical protein [Vibrio tubiashii]MCG9576121.1 hypothetical protein [Vibrio tubiashii]